MQPVALSAAWTPIVSIRSTRRQILSMAAHPTVLDDLDDETAQLIVRLQLEDIAAPEYIQSPEEDRLALQIFEADLQKYSSLRGFVDEEEDQDALEEAPREHGEPAAPPEAATPAPQMLECSACGDSNDREHSYRATCEHEYCSDCLSDLFTISMTDERFFPPRCCTQTITLEAARTHLDNEVATKFSNKQQELADPNKIYCNIPTCSAYVPPTSRSDDLATCPSCQAGTCMICRGGSHEGECPEDAGAQSALEAAKREGWQRCYSCRRMVELTIGCNHITCLCRGEFCYQCGLQWKTCDCDHFREDFLLERAREIVNREGGEAAAVAEQLRLRHECERGEHDFEQVHGDFFICDACHNAIDGIRTRTGRQGRQPYINRCRRCHVDLCRRCVQNLER